MTAPTTTPLGPPALMGPPIDKNGNWTPLWQNFWQYLYARLGGQSAPSNSSIVGQQAYTRGAGWSGGGSAIATPTDNISITCPVAGTIENVQILTQGGPGACVIGVWKSPFLAYPPTAANSITGTDIPQITAGISYSDATLTGWTTSVNAGDVIAFHLASSSVFTTIEILLTIQA